MWGDNGYTISDNLTEGLVYSGMTPQVGTIYDSTCSVKVMSLYNSSAKEPVNPFFYSPLTEDLKKEVDPGFTDWGIRDISKASFEIVDGISCLKLNNSGTNTINISYNRYQFCFGNYIWNSSYRNIYACLTRVRIYDYVISDPLEMKWLMQEIGVS